MAEYIDKDALIKTTEETPFTMSMFLNRDQCEGANMARHTFAEIFKILPAADVVEVRHGRWEDTNKSVRCHNAYRFNWWCSECGEPQHTPVAKTLGEFTKENPFCHCCGAKMDGGADK